MLTSTGRSLGNLLLALVSKVFRHKNRRTAEDVSVRVPAHSESGGGEGAGGGPLPNTAAASSLAVHVCQ